MTERLYYTSDATQGTAQVLSCTDEPDGRYAIVLDKTLFHPQGGRAAGRQRRDRWHPR